MGVEKRSKLNQENEVPIHDQFSHAMRAFEYWCVNYSDTSGEQIVLPTYTPTFSKTGY